MLTLYYAKGTAALPVHILLEEAGAEYDARLLDLSAREQASPEYLAINPRGRVPALVTDRGILTETPAILAWIAQSWPEARLAPLEPFAFAQAQAFNAYLCATVHVNHAQGRRAERWTGDKAAQAALRAEVPRTMTESSKMIAAHLLQGPWVLGDTYSMCDPYLYLVTRWMQADNVDMSAFPALTDHTARMDERQAVQRVMVHHG